MGNTERMDREFELAVVGGGIAGYTAALTAKSLKLDAVWLAPEAFGEKTRAAEYVRNFPSFSGDGVAFCEALERQRAHENIAFVPVRVDGVYAQREEFLLTAGERSFSAQTAILATGGERRGSVKGEREFFGRGVSYCAVCDGALYRGKTIAAVVASPAFAEEAEYLASFAERVHCFCLYPAAAFRAENIVVHDGAPDAVEGGARVEQICKNGQALRVSAVFFLKNSAPPQAICGGLKTDGAHIITDRKCATNLPGLFAAGDVTGTPYQFAKAAGEGLVAAYSARDFLLQKKK